MYTTLDEIINSLMVQLESTDDRAYLRLFELARVGLRELSFDTAKHIKTSLLNINTSTYSVSLPTDYVKYTRIGVYNEDETISYLALADDLYIGNVTPSNASETNQLETDPPVLSDGWGVGKRFGRGGGQNAYGYYRVNHNRNRIEFASNINATQIVLEYITDGLDNLDSSSNVQIHSFLAEALKSYIWWASIKYKRDYPSIEKQMARKDFYNEKRLARARVQNITKSEALVQSRKHFRQSPKY